MEEFACSAVGAVLLLSSLLKWRDGDASRTFLAALGFGGSGALAVVTTFEAVIGALLIGGVAPVEGAAAAVLLGVAFVAVQFRASWLGVAGGCRCFGSLDRIESPTVSLGRAVAFAALAATALGIASRQNGRMLLAAHPLDAYAGVFVGVAFVLVFALVAEVLTFERTRLPAVSANRPNP
jgi:methylamine utilization protein MauE